METYSVPHVGIIAAITVNHIPVRRLLCILLMLVLPLHSFAMQGGMSAFGEMFDIAHEVDHMNGASHHHDDHGAPHYDDSGESAKHFAEHSASNLCIALPSGLVPFLTSELSKAARSDLGQFVLDHIPERPQRPPQSLG